MHRHEVRFTTIGQTVPLNPLSGNPPNQIKSHTPPAPASGARHRNRWVIPATLILRIDVLTRLDTLIGTEKQLAKTCRISNIALDESSVSERNLRVFVTSAFAAVERISGDKDQYSRNLLTARVGEQIGVAGYDESFIPTVTGVSISLRSDVDQGDLTTLAAQLRANTHGDFMVQAHELLDASYHLAALSSLLA